LSFNDLLINTCTVERYPLGVFDALGNPTKVWADHLVDKPCRLSHPIGREIQRESEVVVVDEVLFIDEMDILERDRVIVDSITYHIIFVASMQDGVGGHHLEIDLERVKA